MQNVVLAVIGLVAIGGGAIAFVLLKSITATPSDVGRARPPWVAFDQKTSRK